MDLVSRDLLSHPRNDAGSEDQIGSAVHGGIDDPFFQLFME